MQLFPINLNLQNRKCAVIGGGSVAVRKVKALYDAGAGITVISPKLSPYIDKLVVEKEVAWIRRAYHLGDLKDFFIVVCATDNYEVNQTAADEARQNGALVNVVDCFENCDFTVPSRIKYDDLMITISTNGISPAFSKYIRTEIEQFLGPEYGTVLKIVGHLRNKFKSSISDTVLREGFWQHEIKDIVTLIKQGKLEEAEEKIDNAVGGIRAKS